MFTSKRPVPSNFEDTQSHALLKVNQKENRLIFRWDGFWPLASLKFLNSLAKEYVHDPFSSRDYVLLNRKQIYFLRSFNPACSQAPNVAIKMQTCRQSVDFNLYFIYQKNIFSPNKEQKREKHSSDIRFLFGKQVAAFAQRTSWFAKVCPVLCMYSRLCLTMSKLSPPRKWTNVLGLPIQNNIKLNFSC